MATTGYGFSVRDGDWVRLRQILQRIGTSLLGPESGPTFGEITVTGDVTAGGTIEGATLTDGTLTITGGNINLQNEGYVRWYNAAETLYSYVRAETDSADLRILGRSNLRLLSTGPIDFWPSGDVTDYIRFQTAGDVPEITTIGACDLKITASGGDIDFDDENLDTTSTITGGTITDGTLSFAGGDLSTTGSGTFGSIITPSITSTAEIEIFAAVGDDIDINGRTRLTLRADDVGGFIDIFSAGRIDLMPGNDADDYIELTTTAHQTTIRFCGQDGRITADGGDISFDNENLTTTGFVSCDTLTLTTTRAISAPTGTITLSCAGQFIVDINSEMLFKLSGDDDDYLQIQTDGGLPHISTIGACNLKITASGGTINFDNDNLNTTGTLTATTIGAFQAIGAIDFNNQNATNVDIDSGAIDGVALGATCTQAEWDAAYTHSQDNTQAHSDYLLNTADTMTGTFDLDGKLDLDVTVDTSVGDGINAVFKNEWDFAIWTGTQTALNFQSIFQPDTTDRVAGDIDVYGCYGLAKVARDNVTGVVRALGAFYGSCQTTEVADGGAITVTNANVYYAGGIVKDADDTITTATAFYDAGQTAGATNWGYYGLTPSRIAVDISSAANPPLTLVQDHTTGAQPCLTLDQDDESEGCIDFLASARGIITGATNSTQSVRVELNGTIYRIALYADA